MADAQTLLAPTVGLFVLAAFACWRRARSPGVPIHGIFWRTAAGAVVALAVIRSFGVVEAIVEIGRDWALAGGWYGDRRPLQRWFVFAVALAGLLTLAFVLRRLRPITLGAALSAAGLGLLVGFVLVRAVSAHRIDVFLARSWLGLPWDSVVELSGIALVSLGAAIRPPRPGPHAPADRHAGR